MANGVFLQVDVENKEEMWRLFEPPCKALKSVHNAHQGKALPTFPVIPKTKADSFEESNKSGSKKSHPSLRGPALLSSNTRVLILLPTNIHTRSVAAQVRAHAGALRQLGPLLSTHARAPWQLGPSAEYETTYLDTQ